MELLQFVFSSFWVWLGCVVLIVAAGEAVATAAGGSVRNVKFPYTTSAT